MIVKTVIILRKSYKYYNNEVIEINFFMYPPKDSRKKLQKQNMHSIKK